eukprot:gnl/MRDRNA2_/MRDRNA2_427727_c0_seq1.p1 gnl/MRDRNA2_/MRDRNA2_427727_c0~~gnl/MRDRNA2_/MRDRNA2_427727_c0_seq1.p1  ORF type:complete len:307 (-),score=27.57 gnl/MRDRNA2_/MRDRNA2_427727_c0_seq1:154-939(-)
MARAIFRLQYVEWGASDSAAGDEIKATQNKIWTDLGLLSALMLTISAAAFTLEIEEKTPVFAVSCNLSFWLYWVAMFVSFELCLMISQCVHDAEVRSFLAKLSFIKVVPLLCFMWGHLCLCVALFTWLYYAFDTLTFGLVCGSLIVPIFMFGQVTKFPALQRLHTVTAARSKVWKEGFLHLDQPALEKALDMYIRVVGEEFIDPENFLGYLTLNPCSPIPSNGRRTMQKLSYMTKKRAEVTFDRRVSALLEASGVEGDCSL